MIINNFLDFLYYFVTFTAGLMVLVGVFSLVVMEIRGAKAERELAKVVEEAQRMLDDME